MRTWREARDTRAARIDAGSALAKHKLVEARDAVALLETIIRPCDRVCLEGDNQKQADFLAQCLCARWIRRRAGRPCARGGGNGGGGVKRISGNGSRNNGGVGGRRARPRLKQDGRERLSDYPVTQFGGLRDDSRSGLLGDAFCVRRKVTSS